MRKAFGARLSFAPQHSALVLALLGPLLGRGFFAPAPVRPHYRPRHEPCWGLLGPRSVRRTGRGPRPGPLFPEHEIEKLSNHGAVGRRIRFCEPARGDRGPSGQARPRVYRTAACSRSPCTGRGNCPLGKRHGRALLIAPNPIQRYAQNRYQRGSVVLSGTGIADQREPANSTTEALQLVRHHLKLRPPAVRIEDERGNPVSFFQLKDEAKVETGKALRVAPEGAVGRPRAGRGLFLAAVTYRQPQDHLAVALTWVAHGGDDRRTWDRAKCGLGRGDRVGRSQER